MNMSRKNRAVSVLCLLIFCITMLYPTAIYAVGEAVTVPSDYFAENGKDNIVLADYQKKIPIGAEWASTYKINDDGAAVFSCRKINSDKDVTQGRAGNPDSLGGTWMNTGRVEMTYDYCYTGTMPAGATYKQVMNVWSDGNWFNGPEFKTDGERYTVKVDANFNNVDASGNITIKFYEKPYGADDSEYVVKASPKAKKPSYSKIIPHFRIDTTGFGDTPVETMTIYNITITERKDPKIDLENLTGNLYSTEDSVDINFFLPKGYESAALKINGITEAVYNSDVYPAGSYKATVSLKDYEGENVPVELSATVDGAEQTKTTYLDKITDPSKRETEFGDVSGKEYINTGNLNINFYLPVNYTTAELKIADTVVKIYEPEQYAGGNVYSDSISLHGFEGENLPVVLSVTVNGVVQTASSKIDKVIDGFVPEFKTSLGGVYTNIDKLNVSFSLPNGYTSAYISVDGNIVNEYTSDEYPGGTYEYELDLSEVSGKSIPVELMASIDGRDKKATAIIDEVVEALNPSVEAEEDFSKSTELTMSNGVIENGVLVDDTTGANHCIKKTAMGIVNGYCADLEYDIMVKGNSVYAGAFVRGYEQNSQGSYYPIEGGWFYLQGGGKFSINENAVYKPNEWNNVKYRLFTNRNLIYVYLNGEYIGSASMTGCLGFSEIGIGWNTYGSKVYVDNMKITKWASNYAVSTTDDMIDYATPKIELKFDSYMNNQTVNQDNIKVTSFNGRNIEYDSEYNSNKHTYLMTLKEELIPGKEYTVKISSNVKTAAGISGEDRNIVLKTNPQPFRIIAPNIDLGSISSADTSINVPIQIAASGSDNNGVVFAALFCDGKLISMKAVNVINGVPQLNSVNLSLAGRSGEYSLSLIMCKGINDYSVIDDISIFE